MSVIKYSSLLGTEKLAFSIHLIEILREQVSLISGLLRDFSLDFAKYFMLPIPVLVKPDPFSLRIFKALQNCTFPGEITVATTSRSSSTYLTEFPKNLLEEQYLFSKMH